MLRFVILGSSSSGNALLVFSKTTRLLVDNGFSYKRLSQTLAGLGILPESLDAVVVTHEHADHVKGIGVLARRTNMPVFMTHGCAKALPEYVGHVPNLNCFESGDTLRFNDIEATSFAVSHDAADPVNYIFHSNGAKLGMTTDCGHYSQLTRARLAGSNALVIEANYCPDMLRCGPYPPQIQQRIHSRMGHMSNLDVQQMLRELRHENLRLVVLSHISRDNNTPELACRLAREVLHDFPIEVTAAPADGASPVFEVMP
ncbi:MAG: putative metallo-hydrolase YycJ [Candidatus Hydrogenedentes bacterium ADurb.Bin179]|nr:MAG: putative metallo-hydrolase YycJ [Candidatus Hydrogenedentes bacterium ADurb.Bin179]